MKRLTSNIEGLSARQLAQRCIGAEELSNGRERKLALGDDILMSVSSPARYVGGEVNSVMKTLTPGMVRFAMCFPDVYEIGMSHLGIQILYDMFNRYDDVWCERVYSPWLDLDKIMREKKIPLFALESQESVKEFDFLGITLGYEMCYTNVLQVLDLSHVSLLAKDRKEDDPIVIGGGACAYNPEPIAEFFDMFYILPSDSFCVRLSMMLCLMHIRQTRQQAAPEQTSCLQLPRFPEFMFPLYTM